jgi:hypothetical protein
VIQDPSVPVHEAGHRTGWKACATTPAHAIVVPIDSVEGYTKLESALIFRHPYGMPASSFRRAPTSTLAFAARRLDQRPLLYQK